MAKIDKIKELIGYLKVIFALILATNVGLIGWLVQNFMKANEVLVYADIFLIGLLFVVLIVLNRKIISDIKSLEEL
ncbi:MAG: hypothetical protein HQK84_05570 [Nitrospinae bacterium]|nr:hypothetical protein [Nitrospinota bacterium]